MKGDTGYNKEYFDEYSWNDYYLLNTAILKQYLKIPDKAKLLDVGCGKGFHIKGWRMNGINAEGCDPYSNLDFSWFKSASITDLPYEDDEFDVVTCLDVLEHLKPKDILKSIQELRRVGKDLLIVQTIFSDEDSHEELWKGDKTHVTWMPKSWWLEILETDKYGYILKPFEVVLPNGTVAKFPHPDQLIITKCKRRNK